MRLAVEVRAARLVCVLAGCDLRQIGLVNALEARWCVFVRPVRAE